MAKLIKDPSIKPIPKPIRFLLITFFSLGVLPIVPAFVGYGFVPSLEGISKLSNASIFCGALSAVICLCLALFRTEPSIVGEGKWAILVLIGPIFGFALGYQVLFAIPMMMAVVSGHDIEYQYTVWAVKPHGSKHCHSKIILEETPLLFDSLCGVSSEIMNSVAKGAKIKVAGRGNSLGVFPQRVTLTQ